MVFAERMQHGFHGRYKGINRQTETDSGHNVAHCIRMRKRDRRKSTPGLLCLSEGRAGPAPASPPSGNQSKDNGFFYPVSLFRNQATLLYIIFSIIVLRVAPQNNMK